MKPIVTDLRPEIVVPAMEENFAHWWRFFARAPQATFHDELEIGWLHSGIPLPEYNGVVRSRLRADRTLFEVAAVLVDTVQACALAGVGMSWYLTPSARPSDLGEWLQQVGFTLLGTAPGMAVDLRASGLASPRPLSSGVQIVRVANAAQLAQWVDVAVAAFHETTVVRQARYEVQTALGWDEHSPLQRYVALLDGAPVAMSALFLAGGVAGIYEVVTSPAQRRQGLGANMTRAAMDDAARRGYHVAVLQASPMGEPLYHQLGFRACCQYQFYLRSAHASM